MVPSEHDESRSQLYHVFQECDRNCDGYITMHEVQLACEHMSPEDQRRILEILSLAPGGQLDYQTFKLQIQKYLEASPCESPLSNRAVSVVGSSPGPPLPLEKGVCVSPLSPGPPLPLEKGVCVSPLCPRDTFHYAAGGYWRQMNLRSRISKPPELGGEDAGYPQPGGEDAGYPQPGGEDAGCLHSPFTPQLNSSEFFYQSKIGNLSRKSEGSSESTYTSGDSSIKSDSERTTFYGCGEESSSVGIARLTRVSSTATATATAGSARLRKRRSRRSSPDSCTTSSSSRLCINVSELTAKLEEVRESTAQTKQEITSLFQQYINKGHELHEENLFLTEKRRRLEEMVNLETELIKLRLEGQSMELDKMKTENQELLNRVYLGIKEKDEAEEEARIQKESIHILQEQIHKSRVENRELTHQLENARLNLKALEEHIEYLEERREIQVQEIKHIKSFLESEKEIIREEKLLLNQDRNKYRIQLDQLAIEKDDLETERKNLQNEAEHFRVEKENFLLKSQISGTNDDFVLVETCGDLENILLQNKVLKEGLIHLAEEKTQLQKQIRSLSLNMKELQREQEQEKEGTKFGMSLEQLMEVVREKERVISSLMDTVETLKRNQSSSKLMRGLSKRSSIQSIEGDEESLALQVYKLQCRIGYLERDRNKVILERNHLNL